MSQQNDQVEAAFSNLGDNVVDIQLAFVKAFSVFFLDIVLLAAVMYVSVFARPQKKTHAKTRRNLVFWNTFFFVLLLASHALFMLDPLAYILLQSGGFLDWVRQMRVRTATDSPSTRIWANTNDADPYNLTCYNRVWNLTNKAQVELGMALPEFGETYPIATAWRVLKYDVDFSRGGQDVSYSLFHEHALDESKTKSTAEQLAHQTATIPNMGFFGLSFALGGELGLLGYLAHASFGMIVGAVASEPLNSIINNAYFVTHIASRDQLVVMADIDALLGGPGHENSTGVYAALTLRGFLEFIDGNIVSGAPDWTSHLSIANRIAIADYGANLGAAAAGIFHGEDSSSVALGEVGLLHWAKANVSVPAPAQIGALLGFPDVSLEINGLGLGTGLSLEVARAALAAFVNAGPYQSLDNVAAVVVPYYVSGQSRRTTVAEKLLNATQAEALQLAGYLETTCARGLGYGSATAVGSGFYVQATLHDLFVSTTGRVDPFTMLPIVGLFHSPRDITGNRDFATNNLLPPPLSPRVATRTGATQLRPGINPAGTMPMVKWWEWSKIDVVGPYAGVDGVPACGTVNASRTGFCLRDDVSLDGIYDVASAGVPPTLKFHNKSHVFNTFTRELGIVTRGECVGHQTNFLADVTVRPGLLDFVFGPHRGLGTHVVVTDLPTFDTLPSRLYPQNTVRFQDMDEVGLVNVSAAYMAHVVLSRPHFLGGSSTLATSVVGMDPSMEQHGSASRFDDLFGLKVEANTKMQINYVAEGVFTGHVGYIPSLWSDCGNHLHDDVNEVEATLLLGVWRLFVNWTTFLIPVLFTLIWWRFLSSIRLFLESYSVSYSRVNPANANEDSNAVCCSVSARFQRPFKTVLIRMFGAAERNGRIACWDVDVAVDAPCRLISEEWRITLTLATAYFANFVALVMMFAEIF